MKKYLSAFLALCLFGLLAAGCSGKDAAHADAGTRGSSPSSGDFDVDLTALSSTMVYAEVYNMLTKPDNYIGKTVRMSGPYYASYFDETGLYYHYVVIEDASECCQQGLEFIWDGDHTYPEDYPKEKTKIEVSGVFGKYDELGKTYYYLAVDDLSVMN